MFWVGLAVGVAVSMSILSLVSTSGMVDREYGWDERSEKMESYVHCMEKECREKGYIEEDASEEELFGD